MAQRPRLFPFRIAYLVVVGTILLLTPIPSHAQAHQVYGSGSSTLTAFSKNADGSLVIPTSQPFTASAFQGGPMAIDGLGRFLFVIDQATAGIWMFQIQADGSLTPPANGPVFATDPFGNAVNPGDPISLATESSGQFLYVGYGTSSDSEHGIIVGFFINTAGAGDPQLSEIPAQLSALVQATPIGMAAGSKGNYLYVGLQNIGPQSLDRGARVYEIGFDGELAYSSTNPSENANETCIAMDPQGRFLFEGWGSGAGSGDGFVQGSLISPVDGSLTPIGSPVSLGPSIIPHAMLLDRSGKYLYVSALQNGGSLVYSVDALGNLTASSATSPNTLGFKPGTAISDPQGPYIYSMQGDGIHAFVVDPTTGNLAEITGSPFRDLAVVGVGGLATYAAQVQAVSGPAAEIFPPSLAFPMITIGQSSAMQLIKWINTGTVPVTLTKVTLSGAGVTNFTETPNCSLPATLSPGTSATAICSISVTFVPTSTGPVEAVLTTVTDTAGTQTAQLSGTGIATTSAVTLVPSSLTFASTLQGATSAPQSIQLTNSGSGALRITSVSLSGANPGDFAIASGGCTATTYAVNSTCSIAVSFSPLGDGARSASIIVADDAPGLMQTIPLSGTGAGAPVPQPAVTITPPSIAFGGVAQGSTSGVQNITVTSSGTGALHISNVQLGGANASDFKIANGCIATGYVAGQACTIGLTFTPSVPGTRFATLMIADDGPNSPQTVSITGNSSIPTTSLSVSLFGTSSYSQTVTAGQTASFALQVVSNFNGSVTFSACSGGPSSATCTVPTTPILVTNGVSTPFAINIATTATAAAFVGSARFDSLLRIALATLLCMLVGLGLDAARSWVKSVAGAPHSMGSVARLSLNRVTALFAIFAIILSAISGCGGASTVEQSLPVSTPAQTYTIVVKPSAMTADNAAVNGIAPIQLTLTVD